MRSPASFTSFRTLGATREPVVRLLLGAFNVDHGLGRGASIRRTHVDGFHLSGVFVHLLLAAFNVIHGLDNRSSSLLYLRLGRDGRDED